MPSTGVPRWIVAIAALGAAFVLLPLVAMTTRIDWSQFGTLLASEQSITALLLSLRTSLLATLLCITFGVPLAVVLARTRFRGQGVLRSLVLLPLVLPPVSESRSPAPCHLPECRAGSSLSRRSARPSCFCRSSR